MEPRRGVRGKLELMEASGRGTGRVWGPSLGHQRSLSVLCLFFLLGGLGGCTIPRWPVDRGRLVSAYGIRWRGTSPDVHKGVDISVPEGTEVRTMAPGTVRFAGSMQGYGNVVWVDHNPRLMTVYAHLSQIHVQPGDRLGSRQSLGLSGRSGNATAPLLHFEVRRWGRERDPVTLLGGPPASLR